MEQRNSLIKELDDQQGSRGSPIAIMKFAGLAADTETLLARFRNRAERFGFQPGRLILQALSPAATLVCQVSLIRCAALSSLFVPPLLFFFFFFFFSRRRATSFFNRSKIRFYTHSRCRRRKLTNGIVIRLEYHADDNYSRMRRWLQPRKRHIFGEIDRDYSRISQCFQDPDTRIFGEMCPPVSFVDDNWSSRSAYYTR